MEAPEVFLNLVREYASMIEDRENLKPYQILSRCDFLLPSIYIEALRLPDVDPDPDIEEARIEWGPVRQSLQKILGRYDAYMCYSMPMYDKEPCVGSLSDDLADIYCDLKSAMITYEKGELDTAIWGWKFQVKYHSGEHITGAMKAISVLVHQHMDADYVNPGTRDEEPRAKILEVGKVGIGLQIEDERLFLSYKRFPDFENALLGGIYHVLTLRPGRLYWPDLGIDLEIESIRRPEE